MENKEEIVIEPTETKSPETSKQSEVNKTLSATELPIHTDKTINTGTTLLLNNDNKKSNKSMYKMVVYVVLAIVFGYFITKTDDNKYKIGLIIGFVLLSTTLFNKFFKDPIESNTVIDDDGTNLIEG